MGAILLPRARHREPVKQIILDPGDGGGLSPKAVARIAKRACSCGCQSGARHGAVTLTIEGLDGDMEVEFCAAYDVTLDYEFEIMGSEGSEANRTYRLTWFADDQWWESENITANLLEDDPEELGEQTYRLRMYPGLPDSPSSTTLILYRVAPEGEDPFEELIPAGETLCSWKNATFYHQLYNFKLTRFRRINPDLNLDWSEGCSACVGVVVAGTIPPADLTSCMTTYVTPGRDGKPLPTTLYIRNEEGGQVTPCTWDAESHKWRGPLQLTTIGDLQAMEQFEIECGGVQSGLGIARTITSGDPHFFTLTTAHATGPHGPLVNRSQTEEVTLKDGEGNTLDTFVGAVLTIFEIDE